MQLQFVALGLLVGMLVGVTGAGGGSLMTPMLVLIGMHPTVAVGTDLAYSSATKFVGAIQHFRLGQIRMQPALLLSAGSIPASLMGVGLIGHLRHVQDFNVDRFIAHILAWTLLCVALLLLLQPVARRYLWPSDRPQLFSERLRAMRRQRPKLLVLVGGVVGLLVGLTSVGGGTLIMFAMLLLFPKWPMNQRVGTDILQGFMLSSAATVAHWSLGDVNVPVATQLLLGSIPGVIVGARLTKRVPERALRPLVAVTLAISAVRLF